MDANSSAPNTGATQTTPQSNAETNQPKGPGATGASGAPATQAQGAVSAAAKEAMRKLKIDDQEVDEDEVIKTYKERKGHQQAANKILQEGKARSKQAETFINMLKDEGKLFDVLKAVGHDDAKIRKLAESYLTDKIKYDMMDPKDRDLLEAKQKLKQYEELEKKQREETQKKADDEMKRKYSAQYEKEFVEALQTEKIPGNKFTVSEMARYIARSAKLGVELSVKEAAQLVREDYEERLKNTYGNVDAEYLISALGEETVNKIRAYDVQRLKNPESNLTRPGIQDQGEVNRERRKSGKRMTPQEWRRHNRGF